MRRALCAAIVTTCFAAAPEVKRALAGDLDSMPFERMGDQALMDMAARYVLLDRFEEIVATRSAVRYEVQQLVMCPACQDQHHIEGADERWYPCPRCNRIETAEGAEPSDG